jgi:serine/threonine protein kinase
LAGVDEILDELSEGRATLEETTAALRRARDEQGMEDATISGALERYVATGALSSDDATALTPAPAAIAAAAAPRDQTMLRPSTDVPMPVATPRSAPPPELSRPSSPPPERSRPSSPPPELSRPSSPRPEVSRPSAAPETLYAAGPPGTGGSGSSGWRKWAETNMHGARIGVGDVLRERFVLEEAIGEGGMGLVFRARDRRRDEARDRNPFVAIKILGDDFKSHPDALISLQREARRMQQLSHPNIASVYDFDRDGPHVYLVMELLEGESLEKIIARHPGVGLPPELVHQLIEGAGSALKHAHSRGVVHSDFKPANVFLTRNGEVKIIDFGIARIAKDSVPGTDAALTVFDAGQLGAWTNAYASPEQILAAAEPDARDDIYAFGLVVYEALTGKHPFERKSAVEARFRDMKLEPVAGLTATQNETLAAALAFDRAQRLGDVTALVQALVPSDDPIIAVRDGPRPASGSAAEAAPPSRRIGRTVAMAIGGLAWLAFFAFYWLGRDSSPEDDAAPDALSATTVPAPTPPPEAGEGPATRPAPQPKAVPVAKTPAVVSATPATNDPGASGSAAGSGPQAPVAPSVDAKAVGSSAPTPMAKEAAPTPDEAAAGAADLAATEANASAGESPADPSAESPSSTAELYRWVDKDGKIQFGEKPPDEYASSAVKVMDF